MKTKKKLKRFLEAAGYILRDDSGIADSGLERLMGKRRYEEHLDRIDAMLAGLRPISEVYLGVQNINEAHMLMSLQGHHVLELNHRLIDKLSIHLKDGMEVAELGCWTGTISAFVAQQYPGVSVMGFEREKIALRFALEKWHQPNLKFDCWDYSQSGSLPEQKFSLLWGSFPVDFEISSSFEENVPDGFDLQRWEHFATRCNEAQPYFQNWRAIVRAGAMLIIIPRIPTVEHFAAFLAAAAQCGWEFVLEFSAKVRSGSEVFPFCHFRALPPGLTANTLSSPDLREWWNSTPQ